MQRISEEDKIDVGLAPVSLASTNATGRYYSAKNASRILGILSAAAMVAGAKARLELLQAQDSAGTGAKLVTGASAEITAPTGMSKATITLGTFLATGTITINGVVFTAHATTTTKASRQFSIQGTDTQDAAELVSCINDPTYGVPNVFASSAAGVVTLVSLDGVTEITISSSPDDATCVKAGVDAEAFVEIRTDLLDRAGGFTWVACKVTTTSGTVICAAVLVRGAQRIPSAQAVGASAAI